jgi:AbrB family looped-hinge helix DNA binding protein
LAEGFDSFTFELHLRYHKKLAFGIWKWHIASMKSDTIQIDKAGRVVLPKPLRQRFNLFPGDRLRLSADDTGIKLEPADPGGKLIRKGSVLVFTGEFPEPVTTDTIQRMIREDRESGVKDVGEQLRKS